MNKIRYTNNTMGFHFYVTTKLQMLLIKDLQTKQGDWASLVAQWLGICLSMQGTRVRSLVREDPTCHRATKSVSHND